MRLRLISRVASTSWQQVVLHRDWGRHVAALRKLFWNKISNNLGDLEFTRHLASTQSTGKTPVND